MAGVLAPGAGDAFAEISHRLIRRAGGRGNHGRLVVALDAPPDAGLAAAAWRRLVGRWRPLAGRLAGGLRGARWQLPRAPRAALRLGAPGPVGAGVDAAAGVPARLSVDGARLVMDWDHRLCDARGAMAIVAALDAPPEEPWWQPGYREIAGLPTTAAERGRQARAAIELLAPLRARTLWRPPGGGPQLRGEPTHHHISLGPESESLIAARARAAAGRFAETPFLLAALAAALEAVGGVGGDLLFPLAVDLRPARQRRALTNGHGFAFLICPAGLASRDLAAAAGELKTGFAAWTRAGGERRLLCSLGYFPRLPLAVARHELGNRRAGIAASCLVANTGPSGVPGQLLGRRVLGVDHAVSVPANPGLAVLFSRDARGPGMDLVAAPRVARRLPPAELASAVAEQLTTRSLTTA